MVRARFGTDGVRGVANAHLTVELATALGRAAARVLSAGSCVIGRDTRRSGPMLQAALSAGLSAEGVDVVDVGVLPTPGVALLAAQRGVPAAMVSASHNPFGDNGIKLFDASGLKLTEATESAVESELDALLADPDHPPPRPTGSGVGLIGTDAAGPQHYQSHLRGMLEGRRVDGLRIVVDCANGAASAIAPSVFSSLGADVVAIGCAPDGSNINDGCGSTSPGPLAAAVLEARADLGLAVDGDADRLVAVDHTGAVVDGDTLLALFAVDLAARGLLEHKTVVVTVMTNLGFRHAMAERGIAVRETAVGDRHVLAALDAEGLGLGGEQSGHIVFRRWSTTGDGVLTGLLLADLLVRSQRPLADVSAGLVRHLPQVLVNVVVAQPAHLAAATHVWDAVADVQAELGDAGRVVLRSSGTESVVRVMVEATSEEQANGAAHRLGSVVEAALGTPTASIPSH